MTVQTCASSIDCPASSAVSKRQAGRSFVGADGSTISDINNCCNYDGCNCVGAQCDTIGAGLRTSAAVAVVAIAAVLALFV